MSQRGKAQCCGTDKKAGGKLNPFVQPDCLHLLYSAPKCWKTPRFKKAKWPMMRDKSIQTNFIKFTDKMTQFPDDSEYPINESPVQEDNNIQPTAERKSIGRMTLSFTHFKVDSNDNILAEDTEEKRRKSSVFLKAHRTSQSGTKRKSSQLLDIDYCFRRRPMHCQYSQSSGAKKSGSIRKSTISERSVGFKNIRKQSIRSIGGKIESNQDQNTFTISQPVICKRQQGIAANSSQVEILEPIVCDCNLCPDFKREPPIKSPYIRCDRNFFYEDSTTDRAKMTNSSHLSTKSQLKRSTSGSSPLDDDDTDILKPSKDTAEKSKRNINLTTGANADSDQSKASADSDAANDLRNTSKAQSNVASPKAKSKACTPKAQSNAVSADEDGQRSPKRDSNNQNSFPESYEINITKKKNEKRINLKEQSNYFDTESEAETEQSKANKKPKEEDQNDQDKKTDKEKEQNDQKKKTDKEKEQNDQNKKTDKEKEQNDKNKKTEGENKNCCWASPCSNPCGCCCTCYYPMRCMCACKGCMMRSKCKRPCCSCNCRPSPKCCYSRNR